MLNKNVKKIIASLLVLGSLAGTAATTTEAASRDYDKHRNQKIEYRNDHHDKNKWERKVDSKQQKAYMKKVRQIMKDRNVHVPPGHWVYNQRIPKKVLIKYKEAPRHYHHDWDHDNNDNDLLLGIILGAVLAEAIDNN
ncbi:MAG: hypothetical protein EOL98_13810 [Negativicutes bacterium]|nr:hypothetical protein [Negativicutes bacterium]